MQASIESKESQAWRPLLFAGTDSATPDRLRELELGHLVTFRHDTIVEQLVELLDTREPAARLPRHDLEQRAFDLIGGPAAAEHFGSWVYYPWSRRLVHVLPQAEFREAPHQPQPQQDLWERAE